MKKIILIGMIALLLLGCAKEAVKEGTLTVPDSVKDPNRELVEKRGQTTDIQDFQEFLVRASKIQSWEFTVDDSKNDAEYKVYQLERYQSVTDGDVTVKMDRVTKTALLLVDPANKEYELTDYEKYHQFDPYEMMTAFLNADYVGDDIIGNDYVKTFSGKFYGEPAMISVQEYYGYPLRIETESRTIEYKDIVIDHTQRAKIAIPFNTTIEGKKYWNWEHYLGIMPTRGGEPQAAA